MDQLNMALSFAAGILFKALIEYCMNYLKEKQRSSGTDKSERREAHEEFLAALVPAFDDPTKESVGEAKKKFIRVEVSSDKLIVSLGDLILSLLDSTAKGTDSSFHKNLPVLKSALVELIRAEITNRKPQLEAFEEAMLRDPFYAEMVGKPHPIQER
ncbi:hypothetical protein [Neptunomonas sp.]|uniref:hypothetical protein n=1 Tax=Neptunomonas sp. TaxID=1971898 RepID=UPI003564A9A2